MTAPYKFMLLAWWKGLGKKIQWGDFELHAGMPPRILLEYLTTGNSMLKRVTFPEGFTLQQIARRLSENNLVEEKAFLASAGDPQWLDQLGIEGQSLEGYLFPGHLCFSPGHECPGHSEKNGPEIQRGLGRSPERGGNQRHPQSEKNCYSGLHGGKRKRPSQRAASGGLGFL